MHLKDRIIQRFIEDLEERDKTISELRDELEKWRKGVKYSLDSLPKYGVGEMVTRPNPDPNCPLKS